MPWTAPCSHLLPEAHPFQPQCSVYSAPFLMELQVPITGNTFLFQLFISQLKWISDSVSREGVFLGEGMKRLDMLGIWGRWRTQKRTFRPKFRFVRGVHSLLSLGSQGGMRGHDAGEMPCSPLQETHSYLSLLILLLPFPSDSPLPPALVLSFYISNSWTKLDFFWFLPLSPCIWLNYILLLLPL